MSPKNDKSTEEEDERTWKPLTSSWKFLFLLSLFPLVIAVLLAVSLYRYIAQGLVLAVSSPTAANIAFQYLPIIVAIIYGGLWGWIDLDTKRLAPWYDLYGTDRIAAFNALMLQYPVDFGLSVPFRSAKRRHWVVCITSVAAISIYWAVTPLLGSTFVIRPSLVSRDGSVSLRKGLAPATTSSRPALSRTLLFAGLNIEYFDQDLPPFTTSDSTFIPFLQNTDVPTLFNTTATYETIRYTSDLHCWPPKDIKIEKNAVGVDMTFDDGRGCVARNIPMFNVSSGHNRSFDAWYLGWQFDDRIDYSLSTAGCPESAAHRFLAIMTGNDTQRLDFNDSRSATALFCETEYLQQQVKASVSLADQRIVSYTPLADMEPLEDGVFNITLFEYILSTGWTPATSAGSERSDVSDTTTLNLGSLLLDKNIGDGSGNMVPFGLGATKLDTTAYFNSSTLHEAYRSAHQLLFAVSARQVLDQVDNISNSVSAATFTSHRNAVTLQPILGSILEAVLILIFGSTLLLMFIQNRRQTALHKDPRSISDTISCIRERRLWPILEHATPRQKANKFGRLQSVTDVPRSIEEKALPQVFEDEPSPRSPLHSLDGDAGRGDKPAPALENRQPGRLTHLIIGIFASAVLITAVAISTLKILSDQHHGLKLPEMSSLAEQILLNYLPTLLATVTEPLWIELCRTASIYLPFTELATQVLPAKSSLDLVYASYLPQFLILLAARAGHYLVSALAISGVLSNVLTVAMNGLFVTSSSPQTSTIASHPIYKPSVEAGSFSSSFVAGTIDTSSALQSFTPYLQMANLTDPTVSLPPWVGDDYYFLPHNISASAPANSSYTVSTLGIGGMLSCAEHTISASDHQYSLSFARNMSQIDISLTFRSQTPDGQGLTCFPAYSSFLSFGNGVMDVGGNPFGVKASELASIMSTNISDPNQDTFCSRRMVLGWFRTNASLEGPLTPAFSENGIAADINTANATLHSNNQTIISCFPQARSARFNVTVSPDGHILNAIQLGPSTIQPSQPGELYHNVTNYMTSLMLTSYDTKPEFHDDTFAINWANFLIKLLRNSPSFLDATQPPPDAQDAMDSASAVYARLWATYASLIANKFEKPSAQEQIASTVQGTHTEDVRKVFVSKHMFWIALAILVWDFGLCLVLYVRMPRPFMDVVPVSIASVAGLFEGSHCIDDFGDEKKGILNAEGSETGPEKEGRKKVYAYGHFIGTDGKERVGIDRYPYAVPLNLMERRKWKIDRLWS